MPAVNVIIPTYNGRRRGFLGLALASVRAQTFKPARVILVDDGSQDDTVPWVRREFPEVEVVEQANAGPSAARNRGLAIADGDFIAFLDDDDEWLPEKLASQVDFFARRPEVDLVFGAMDLVDRLGRKVGHKSPAGFGHTFPASMLGNSFLPPSTLMLRRRLAQRVGPFDESLRLGEDYEYCIRCSRYGSVATLPEALVRYRVHDASSCPDYRIMDRANLRIIENAAARDAPDQARRIRDYFCYGALARALLKRDWTYVAEMRTALGGRLRPLPIFMRMIGLALTPVAPLKNAWRRLEYRRVLGTAV